jgi:hypothetical protein
MRSPVALEAEVGEQFPDPADVIDQTEQRAELAALTAAIAELPPRQREAIALRDFLGLSYEEVASTLSVSVPVVESLLFRARRRLRDTVRTVPRYAAGVAAIPFALKAALTRDGDLDTAATIGVAGAAGTAVAAVVAKLISLPFATKAATAVTVVTMATAGPQLGGLFGDESAPEEAPAVAAPQLTPSTNVADPGGRAAEVSESPPVAPPATDGPDDTAAPADNGGESAGAGSAPIVDLDESPASSPAAESPAEEAEPAEPEPIREVVTTAEPPEAPAAEPAAPEATEEPPASAPLPVGPDGLPIIGLEPEAGAAPAEAPPETSVPAFGPVPVIGAPHPVDETPSAPHAEAPADAAGTAVTPGQAGRPEHSPSKG